MDWDDFDSLFSPMVNNPYPLFKHLKEGHKINVLEAFIALVFYCYDAEYDDRIRLIFNVFDIDGGGTLDRKEASKLISCSIYGLCKLAGLPVPGQKVISAYI